MSILLALMLAADVRPAAAPLDFEKVLSGASRVEAAGWSADERRVVLRVFHGAGNIEAEPCPGYVDSSGNPFVGGLALFALEQDKVLGAWRIQDEPLDEKRGAPERKACTPAGVAKTRLAAAKEGIAALGVSLGSAGTQVSLAAASQAGAWTLPGALHSAEGHLEFSVKERVEGSAATETLSGDFDVSTVSGATRTSVAHRTMAGAYDPNKSGAGSLTWEQLLVSPRGSHGVVLVSAETHDAQSGRSQVAALGVMPLGAWDGATPPLPTTTRTPAPLELETLLEEAWRVEVAGWSPDEHRLALRVFSRWSEEASCPGFVDSQGKPFSGRLTLLVLEGDRVLAVWPIQDDGLKGSGVAACTPPAVAKTRLAQAKKDIAKLGVSFDSPGKPIALGDAALTQRRQTTRKLESTGTGPMVQEVNAWVGTMVLEPARPKVPHLELVVTRLETKDQTVNEVGGLEPEATLERADISVFVVASRTRAALARKTLSIDVASSVGNSGTFTMGPAFASPSGSRVLVFASSDIQNPRLEGPGSRFYSIGMFNVGGSASSRDSLPAQPR